MMKIEDVFTICVFRCYYLLLFAIVAAGDLSLLLCLTFYILYMYRF